MIPIVSATAEQLLSAPMFSSVGKCPSLQAKIVVSWSEAITECSKVSYENLRIRGANSICDRLREVHPKLLSTWNDVADENSSLVSRIIVEKVQPISEVNQLPPIFVTTVRWDIAHLLMEAAYSESIGPGFFSALSYWYWKGYFPCGWDGDHPAGRVMVY